MAGRRCPSGNPWRKRPIHRLAVYTEHGFTPELLERFFNEAMGAGCSRIVDPFAGSGTAIVEAQQRCIDSIAIDASPWSLMIMKAKTTPVDIHAIIEWFKGGAELPRVDPLLPSPQLRRYYESDTLDTLARLRRLINEAPVEWQPLLLVVFSRVALEYSILERTPAPRFTHTPRARRRGDPAADMLKILVELEKDYARHRFCGPVTLVWADSTTWLPRRVCAAVTSPPFANNIDYVRHTMLELLWAGLARDSRDLGWLRSLQVPASEATARSWRPTSRRREHLTLAGQISGKRAWGYRRFLLQYLYSMERHFQLLAETLEWEAWYTIGDSILGGAYIPTHELLADAARRAGLKATIEEITEPSCKGRATRRLYLLRVFQPR